VHHEVDRHGLHAEVIRADSAASLAAHLFAKNVRVLPAALNSLAAYYSDHPLIVVRIDSRAELHRRFPDLANRRLTHGRWPCIFVAFETSVPFFPLRPTAAYGELVVPFRVYVTGLHAPATASALQAALKVSHFSNNTGSDSGIAKLLGGVPASLDYTLIRARLPAEAYTDDLTLHPVTPRGWTYGRFIHERLGRPGAFALFVTGLLAFAYLSGGLVGCILFRRWWRPALIGLASMLTVFGLILVVRRANFMALRTPSTPAISESSLKAQFVLGVLAIYMILTFAASKALQAPLG
jgi:hypothetical protein